MTDASVDALPTLFLAYCALDHADSDHAMTDPLRITLTDTMTDPLWITLTDTCTITNRSRLDQSTCTIYTAPQLTVQT